MDTATVGTLCQDINLLQIMPFNGTKRLMPVPFPLCVRLGAASVGTSGFGSAELRPVGMSDVRGKLVAADDTGTVGHGCL